MPLSVFIEMTLFCLWCLVAFGFLTYATVTGYGRCLLRTGAVR